MKTKMVVEIPWAEAVKILEERAKKEARIEGCASIKTRIAQTSDEVEINTVIIEIVSNEPRK